MKSLSKGFLFILLLTTHFLNAQSPFIEWHKTLGGLNGEYAHSIEPTNDGGYIVAGYTEGPDGGDIMGYHGNFNIGDIWVVKLDAAGNTQWQKSLGGTYMETGAWIHQTADGGYIVGGSSASVDCNIKSHNSLDYWIVKLNSTGDIEWQKSYGGSQNEYAYGISIASDGGYFMAGHSESIDGDVTGNHGLRDYWVIKLDVAGNLLWQKSLGGTADDEAYSVKSTNDGGCIVAGGSDSNDGDVSGNHGKRDYWVVKLGNTGAIQWQKSLGGSLTDEALSLQATTDGGYIIAGFTASNDGNVSGNHNGIGPGDSDCWIVKLAGNGTLQWQKCYGGDKNEIAFFIQLTPDGGYVISGSSESANGDLTCNAGITDAWVIKINSAGTPEWQKSMGGILYEEAFCVQPLNDGSYIVSGNTCSRDVSGYHYNNAPQGSCADFWVVKLSAPLLTAPRPVVTISPATAEVCAGNQASFQASARFAGTNPNYRWERNGIAVGSNSSTYTASDFTNNDNIICYVTGGGTCETIAAEASNTVIVKINSTQIQPAITIAADNAFLCECTPITVKASVTNAGPAPFYQWKVNGANTGNNTNLLTGNTFKDGDIVSCVYTDNAACVANGSVVSNSIVLKSYNGQAATVSISTPAAAICAGSPVTFTAVPQNAGINPTIQWKVNNMNVGTNSSSFTSSALANGDLVSCTVKPDLLFTCTPVVTVSSNTILLSVSGKGNPGVTITATASTICTGSDVTFTAVTESAGANPSFQWKVNGINAGINSNRFTTSALLNGDIVNCTINPDPLFTCANPVAGVSNNIAMTVTNDVSPTLVISASGNDVCAGTNLTFSALAENAGSSPVYAWKLNGVKVGQSEAYSSNTLSNGDELLCTVSPGDGACSKSPVSSNTILAVINPLPVIMINPVDTTILTGGQVQFRATISGNAVSYQWSPASQLENPGSLTPTTIHLSDNTTYMLTAKNDKGCSAFAKTTVTIFRPLFMPGGFTPNGDGINDVYRIPPHVSLQLEEFSIFDRWGNRIFTTRDISRGWDGTIVGLKANAAVYVYTLKGSNEKGAVFLKGIFTLIR